MRKKGLTEKQIQILQTLNNKGQIKRYASILAYMIKHKNPGIKYCNMTGIF